MMLSYCKVENEENASKRRKAKTKGVCDSVTDS
jgi:hypothetical protein